MAIESNRSLSPLQELLPTSSRSCSTTIPRLRQLVNTCGAAALVPYRQKNENMPRATQIFSATSKMEKSKIRPIWLPDHVHPSTVHTKRDYYFYGAATATTTRLLLPSPPSPVIVVVVVSSAIKWHVFGRRVLYAFACVISFCWSEKNVFLFCSLAQYTPKS